VTVPATLFGESATRVVVSASAAHLAAVLAAAAEAGVPAAVIGRTGGTRIQLAVDGAVAVDVDVSEAERRWATSIETRMARTWPAGSTLDVVIDAGADAAEPDAKAVES
jgi:hypothetical protein